MFFLSPSAYVSGDYHELGNDSSPQILLISLFAIYHTVRC